MGKMKREPRMEAINKQVFSTSKTYQYYVYNLLTIDGFWQ